ncbi:hypothetical protein BJY52DRAFT_1197719 [Lactarius psammicola]|nr:hypothetical protein BJY52DRAFT_1197719 [Lactarius psammicola]
MDPHPGLLNTTTIVRDLGVTTSFPLIYLSSLLLVLAFVFRVVLYIEDIESEDTFNAVHRLPSRLSQATLLWQRNNIIDYPVPVHYELNVIHCPLSAIHITEDPHFPPGLSTYTACIDAQWSPFNNMATICSNITAKATLSSASVMSSSPTLISQEHKPINDKQEESGEDDVPVIVEKPDATATMAETATDDAADDDEWGWSTKKTPNATPGPTTFNNDVSAPNDGNTLSPNKRPSTKGPGAGVDEGTSPVVVGKKTAMRQGKAEKAAPKAGRPSAQVTTTMPTHSLPSRPGRNVHPAGQPKIRRSKEQIEADCEAGAKVLEEKIREVQMAKDHLVQLNIMEECKEDDLPLHTQCSSTVVHKRRHMDIETDSDEAFDLREVDGNDNSDNSDSSSPKSDKMTKTKSWGKKCVKGAACQELLTRTEELRGVQKSQRQQKLKRDVGSARPSLQELRQLDVDDLFELGGICESDLEETHPVIAEVEGPQVLVTDSLKCYDPDASVLSHTWDSSTLVKTIQVVFNLSFTNVSHTLSLQDGVVKAAYNQMKTRRSKIASDVLTLVRIFFECAKFKNQPEKIKDYVHWALRSGGPAYYETPVPKSCTLRKDDPDYPIPDGFLCSQFILPIAESFITLSEKSVLNPSLGSKNPPKTLYAIILTAVERAMRAHMTGAFNPPSDFNHRTTWNAMKDFYRILDQISESRWARALNFANNDDTESCVNESLLSAYHIDFYIPSSPTKFGA